MKSLIVLLSTLYISILNPVFAQTYPTLPTNWTGTVAIASIGSLSKMHLGFLKNSKKEWSIIEEPRELRVTRQIGRFVEMKLSTERAKDIKIWTGIISADGHKLHITSPTISVDFDIRNSNQLVGCGSVRGDSGTYEHWHNNYGTICFEFTAVKLND